jgi:hypothetical protein
MKENGGQKKKRRKEKKHKAKLKKIMDKIRNKESGEVGRKKKEQN